MFAGTSADIVSEIYATIVYPQRWRDVLQQMADLVGAVGAVAIRVGDGEWVASPRLQPHVEAYVAEGWMHDPARAAPLIAERHPGFRSEYDYRTREELDALPVTQAFLKPRGWQTGLGTMFQGARDDLLQIAVEGLESEQQAAAAIPVLDELRPHIGRALTLSFDLEQGRVHDIAEALGMAGYDAAIVSSSGQPIAINRGFEGVAAAAYRVTGGRLQFRDAILDAQFARMLGTLGSGSRQGASVIAANRGNGDPFVLHMVPLPSAQVVFGKRQAIALIAASGTSRRFPQPDVLRVLFDLTPAEERLCRILAKGYSVAEAAAQLRVQPTTCRVHLRSIFAKTGVSRQSSLIRLLFRSRLVA